LTLGRVKREKRSCFFISERLLKVKVWGQRNPGKKREEGCAEPVGNLLTGESPRSREGRRDKKREKKSVIEPNPRLIQGGLLREVRKRLLGGRKWEGKQTKCRIQSQPSRMSPGTNWMRSNKKIKKVDGDEVSRRAIKCDCLLDKKVGGAWW